MKLLITTYFVLSFGVLYSAQPVTAATTASQASVQSPGLPAEVRAKILAAKAQKNSAERTRQRAAKLKAALVHAGGGAPQTPFVVPELCTIIASYGSDQEPVDWSIRDVVRALDGQLYVQEYDRDRRHHSCPVYAALLGNCGINNWDGFDIVQRSTGVQTWQFGVGLSHNIGLDVRNNAFSCVPVRIVECLQLLIISGNPLTEKEARGLPMVWIDYCKSPFLRYGNEVGPFDPAPGAPFTIPIVMPATATTAAKPEPTVGSKLPSSCVIS